MSRRCRYCGRKLRTRTVCVYCEHLLALDPEYAETTDDVLAMPREPLSAPQRREVAS